MGFLSKVVSKVTGKSSKYGWLTGGEFPYAENRVGSFLNNIAGSTDMYNREYEGNVALWNMQNEYNTPAAQIARMKAAGIDVNPLTYAVGNGSMSTTGGNISAPSVGASGINPVSTLLSVLSGIESVKGQKIINQTGNVNLSAMPKLLRNQILSGDVSIASAREDVRAKQLANDMTQLDKEFYKKHGYRPGTESPYTIIPQTTDSIIGGVVDYIVPEKGLDYDPDYRDYYDLQGKKIRVKKKH